MNLQQLLEEIVTSYKNWDGKWYPIYLLTPQHAKEDMEKAIGKKDFLRFIATNEPRKEVYVFSDEILHHIAFSKLSINELHSITGIVKWTNNKWKLFELSTFYGKKKDWAWLNQYFEFSAGRL